MFRGAFQRAIQAATLLGVDSQQVSLWEERLSHLALPPVSDEGFWKAMEDREPYYEGHSYLLPLVFPAELVSQFHGPREWLDQARKTWNHLKEAGHRSYTGEAWCGGQGIGELLRLEDLPVVDFALSPIETQSKEEVTHAK